MPQYKWVALSNTTLSILMGSINGTIVLISLPAIFRGIDINPLASFQYLLWVLFGYSIVTATLLVTFGRISDMHGRVRMYNFGFAIFTVGSILLYLTPSTGDAGALELIFFRIVQGIGAAFLMANGPAILTDAFPPNERGKALGMNQVAGLAGSLVGLTAGGILASADWRYVFLVSVPFGIIGTAWSYLKLKELATIKKNQKLDIVGNTTFAAGLTIILVAVSYGLIPYRSSTMGWGDPWVIAGLGVGSALLIVFPFIETHVAEPMFRLELFRIRMFSTANFANFLSSIGQGGVQIILIILLQGIWLPLHGYSYSSTPFWAGVYMIPMIAGFVVMGPISGVLSDKYGAKGLSTIGMIIVGSAFIGLSFLPYNFDYIQFAIVLFFMGFGTGMFASPNTASIMNSVPKEQRGAASGMMSTLRNTGMTASLVLFFTVIITDLSDKLPSALKTALTNAGVPQLASIFDKIPPTGALFAAFLGYNPMSTMLSNPQLSPLLKNIPQSAINYLEGTTFFPNAIAPAFMSALQLSFYVGAAVSFAAAISSVFRGRIYIHDLEQTKENGGGKESITTQRSEITIPDKTGLATARTTRKNTQNRNSSDPSNSPSVKASFSDECIYRN